MSGETGQSDPASKYHRPGSGGRPALMLRPIILRRNGFADKGAYSRSRVLLLACLSIGFFRWPESWTYKRLPACNAAVFKRSRWSTILSSIRRAGVTANRAGVANSGGAPANGSRTGKCEYQRNQSHSRDAAHGEPLFALVALRAGSASGHRLIPRNGAERVNVRRRPTHPK